MKFVVASDFTEQNLFGMSYSHGVFSLQIQIEYVAWHYTQKFCDRILSFRFKEKLLRVVKKSA